MLNSLVSIKLPTFNAEKYIHETIESVLIQTYQNWELIITDDESSDSTKEILKEYIKKDDRIRFYQLPDKGGAGAARNNSINLSSGRFIAFLDSDDIWLPQKLEKQVQFMLDNECSLSYTSYAKMEENGQKRGDVRTPPKVRYKDLLNTNVIATLTAMYDTKTLGKCYMNSLKKRQDYCLWLSILKKVDYAMGIDEVLAKYRVSKSSLSGDKWSAMLYQWKVYRDIEKISLTKSIYHFINYAINGFIKYRI